MRTSNLDALVARCQELVEQRHPAVAGGAAAMLTSSGRVLLGTAPDANNPAVEVCHEVEPYCAAHRLGEAIEATVCLYREPGSAYKVVSPCGVCQERLATHGPTLLVAVPQQDASQPAWIPLRELMPHYWLEVFEHAPVAWLRD